MILCESAQGQTLTFQTHPQRVCFTSIARITALQHLWPLHLDKQREISAAWSVSFVPTTRLMYFSKQDLNSIQNFIKSFATRTEPEKCFFAKIA